MSKSKLFYLTYQTFPAQTANSLQTISNIKYLVRNNLEVSLYFPLREKQSNDEILTLQKFYEFSESVNTVGVKHSYPHGKIKIFPKLWFHLSHFLWSKKLINNNFKNNTDDNFLTRSEWIAYFLAKQGSKVVFECHQPSRVRNFVINNIGILNNVKFVFLNENLQNKYQNLKNSVVLHNGVDGALFKEKEDREDGLIIFLGNTNRFNKSRGIGETIIWFSDNYLKENYKLEIIGGSKQDCKYLNDAISELNLSNIVKTSPWVGRKEAAKKLSRAKFGLLINTPDNEHSYLYTSPLKYFEYLYSGLAVIAVDFPSHRSLPLNEKIGFFRNGDKEDFINKLKMLENVDKLSENEKYSISLDNRAKLLIKYIF